MRLLTARSISQQSKRDAPVAGKLTRRLPLTACSEQSSPPRPLATMVSAYRVDTLRNPTLGLQDSYRDCAREGTANFPRLVSDHYAHVFRAPEAFNEVRENTLMWKQRYVLRSDTSW